RRDPSERGRGAPCRAEHVAGPGSRAGRDARGRGPMSARTMLIRALRAAAIASALTAPTVGAQRAVLAEPSLSPDGREVAFTAGGDIWIAPATGGDARLV